MWLTAFLENATSRLTAARRWTATRVHARDLTIVFGRVVAILFALEVVYLAAGNAVLRSQLVKDAVNATGDFHLEYASAYTLLPGRVHVQNLAIRVEDYNVQFIVGVGEATLDVSLSELPFKKFHLTRLDAERTTFRMRHKLIVVGEDAERVAAYPPIEGFADPPFYTGVRSPSIPDEEYDLWEVRIEHVQAAVSELWVLEHRYRGAGRAAGSFVVRPGRWVQVEPASLELNGGTLTLGERVVARDVRGRMRCSVPDMDVRASEGAQVLKEISAQLALELKHGDLDFLNAYLARLGPVTYSGSANWRVDVAVERGVIQRGSRMLLQAAPLRVHTELGDVMGDVDLSFARDPAPSVEQLVSRLSAPRLVAQRAGQKAEPPWLEGLEGNLALRGVDLTGDMSLGSARLSVRRVHAPALAWFQTGSVQLQGQADAQLQLERDEKSQLSGDARLALVQAGVTKGDFSARGELTSKLRWSRSPESDAPVQLDRLSVALAGVTLRSGDKRSQPFGVSLEGSDFQLLPRSKPQLRGTLALRVTSAEALLPLVVGSVAKELTSGALDLQGVRARATVKLEGKALDIRVLDAQSGNLRMRGYLSQRERQPRAAFLLSTGPINVGVTLRDGQTEVSPFVSDDWLAATWPGLAPAARPGRG